MASLRVVVPGQKLVTTAGTQVALVAASKKVRKAKIKALAANTGAIYVGPSTVDSATGYVLSAGQELDLTSLFWKEGDLVDLNTVYIDSAVNGEGVSFIYVE